MNSRHYVLAEIAGILDERRLTEIIDAVIGSWHGPPEATLDELRTGMAGIGRFTGSQRLARAIVRARPGVDSPQETRLRLSIINAGLPEPAVHPAVQLGSTVAHPDLGYPAQRIAVEYEGDHHRTDPQQWDRDIARYSAMADHGWTVVRVTRSTSTSRLMARLRRLLDQAEPR